MEVKYEEDKEEYIVWAEKLCDEGFTVSMKKVIDELRVSRKWILVNLQPVVRYVKYGTGVRSYLRKKFKLQIDKEDNSNLFFNEWDLRTWLVTNCEFTRQTKVISLREVFEGEEIEIVKKKASYMERISPEYLPPDYKIIYQKVRPDVRQRNLYPHIPVEPFDFWDVKKYFPTDFPNGEQAYRYFFKNGMIKISMLGKSIFVKEKDIFLGITVSAEIKKEKEVNDFFIKVFHDC